MTFNIFIFTDYPLKFSNNETDNKIGSTYYNENHKKKNNRESFSLCDKSNNTRIKVILSL